MRLISLGGAPTDGLLTRIAGDIGDAVGAVEKFWGTDWDHEIVVIATDSQAQFVAQAGLAPDGNWADIAAVSVADHVDFAHHHASGQRIVFAPGAANMSDGSLRIVLTHELFHLAARADTALDAPRWLLEGVADFVARPPRAATGRTPRRTPRCPPTPTWMWPGRSGSGATTAPGGSPDSSPTRYGVDALRRLYVEACGPGHGDFETAVHRALGTDTAELRARWAQWLTR